MVISKDSYSVIKISLIQNWCDCDRGDEEVL